MVHGQCLCGSVRFRGEPDRERCVTACHCGQCRRWGGGGPLIAVRFIGGLEFEADESLTWFRSSDEGERGFCSRCGSSLFWRMPGQGNDVSTSLGALDEDHGLEIDAHIFVEDKPDWYEFADDRPRCTAAEWAARKKAPVNG
ncbi:MAG TPA: GFA family protein [Paracoccaceae bacterium]|nr:GFA family protein [Paracoccaceae bacterium]